MSEARPPGDEPSAVSYSDAEIDEAIAALSDSDRLRRAQDDVARAAPQLNRVFDEALSTAGWFGSAHEGQVLGVAGLPDVDDRVAAVRRLVGEETRLAMLVGVAIGWELAYELEGQRRRRENP